MEMSPLLELWREGPIGAPPRPRPSPRAARIPLTTRPWDAADGDPARPGTVGGVAVVNQLRTRRDGPPGALVVLEDGRYAFTGSVVAVGTRTGLQAAAARRLRLAAGDSERGWWREVIGALAAPED